MTCVSIEMIGFMYLCDCVVIYVCVSGFQEFVWKVQEAVDAKRSGVSKEVSFWFYHFFQQGRRKSLLNNISPMCIYS